MIGYPYDRPYAPGMSKPAAQLHPFLLAVGFDVPCEDVAGDPVGACTGCANRDHHPAFCHVHVAGIQDALCLAGLPSYLRVTKETVGLEGAFIEVIKPREAA